MEQVGMEELVTGYGPAIYRLSRSLTKNTYDAEDLYQQTFLKALDKLGSIDKSGNPKALLMKICVALWKGQQRKFARRQRIAPTSSLEEGGIVHAAADENVEDAVIEEEQRRWVWGIVHGLPERYRIPVLLCYQARLSVDEIAKVCGCPAGTVKSRLHTARGMIKKELEVRGYER